MDTTSFLFSIEFLMYPRNSVTIEQTESNKKFLKMIGFFFPLLPGVYRVKFPKENQNKKAFFFFFKYLISDSAKIERII